MKRMMGKMIVWFQSQEVEEEHGLETERGQEDWRREEGERRERDILRTESQAKKLQHRLVFETTEERRKGDDRYMPYTGKKSRVRYSTVQFMT